MFAYCSNNPTNNTDSTGNDPATLLFGLACLAISAIVAVAAAVIVPATVQVVNKIVDTTAPAINRQIAQAKDAVARTKSEVYKQAKALVDTTAGKYDNHQPRVHHIVPVGQFSNRSDDISNKVKEMQTILLDVGINPASDPQNLVIISQGFHKSLHTNAYITQLYNSLVLAKGNRKAVERVLFCYRIIISFSDPFAFGG